MNEQNVTIIAACCPPLYAVFHRNSSTTASSARNKKRSYLSSTGYVNFSGKSKKSSNNESSVDYPLSVYPAARNHTRSGSLGIQGCLSGGSQAITIDPESSQTELYSAGAMGDVPSNEISRKISLTPALARSPSDIRRTTEVSVTRDEIPRPIAVRRDYFLEQPSRSVSKHMTQANITSSFTERREGHQSWNRDQVLYLYLARQKPEASCAIRKARWKWCRCLRQSYDGYMRDSRNTVRGLSSHCRRSQLCG